MRILLFKTGPLGDVLMTTPAVRQLRKQYPDARIDYMVGTGCLAILQQNPYLDNVIPFDATAFFEHRIKDMWSAVKLMRGYDMAFIFDKHWIFPLAAWLARIPCRIGFQRDAPSRLFLNNSVLYGPIRHETLYYLDLIKKTGVDIDEDDLQLDLHIREKTQQRMDRMLSKRRLEHFVCCINSGGNNPGERGHVRRLPDSIFKRLVAELATAHNVVLIGGKQDHKYYERLHLPATDLAGTLSIEESAAVMRRAQRIYTTDCGPMHIAAAVNRHITAYFGPTNPARKAPLVDDGKSIWTDQDIYDERYELYGRLPEGTFFRRMPT